MHADRTNRIALALLGLLLLIAGAAGITASAGVDGAAFSRRILFANPASTYIGHHGGWLWPAVAAACLLLALACLRWLLALLVSTDRARDLTVPGPADHGTTTLQPAALTGALSQGNRHLPRRRDRPRPGHRRRPRPADRAHRYHRPVRRPARTAPPHRNRSPRPRQAGPQQSRPPHPARPHLAHPPTGGPHHWWTGSSACAMAKSKLGKTSETGRRPVWLCAAPRSGQRSHRAVIEKSLQRADEPIRKISRYQPGQLHFDLQAGPDLCCGRAGRTRPWRGYRERQTESASGRPPAERATGRGRPC